MASSVRVQAPHIPLVHIAIAAGRPFTDARRVTNSGATYRATFAIVLAWHEVEAARARLALSHRAAVLSRRWKDAREVEGAQRVLERAVDAHHRAQVSTPAANDTPTTPGPAAARAA